MWLSFQNPSEWGNSIERYGLPLVVLIVLAWAAYRVIWKVLLPRLDKRDEMVQQQHERIIQFLDTQLSEAREARTQEVNKFVNTIDNTIGMHTAAINTLADEVKRKRDPRH